jgi:predicted phage terminase large subunit-like protein
MAELTLKKKFTKKEFQRRADEILGALFREATTFPDISEAAKGERRERSRRDHFYFFKTYLPHYFAEEPAEFHAELIELTDRRPGKGEVVTPAVVAAPREFAKTTVISFGYSLHQICHKLRHFIMLASDSEDLASDLTGYIYLELLYNERIKCDFGELVRDNWAVDDFVTLNDIRLMARGRGQRLRGLKHKQHRPDLIMLDDLENDQNVKNPRLVKDLLNWIKTAVYAAIDARGSLLWIGTILAKRSALATALFSDEEPWRHWVRRVYRAIQEDGSALWPERHPLEKLLEQKKMMGSLAFNREKMNDPRDEEGMFQEEWIRYYHPADLSGKALATVAFFDPSLETGASADFKAIITVGVDYRDMIVYVLDAFIKRCTLDTAFDVAFSRHHEHGFQVFGVEDNLFQRLLLKEFERLGRERREWLPVRGVTSKLNKETRIARLSPYVEKGNIRFRRGHSDQDLLVEQLIYFPSKTVHDDGPDALEGAVSLLQNAVMGPVEYETVIPGRFSTERRGADGYERVRGAW